MKYTCNNLILSCHFFSVTLDSALFLTTTLLQLNSLNFDNKVKVKVTLWLTVGQSVSQSWCRAPSGAHDQIFITVWKLRSCFCGAPSLTRGRVCLLYMVLAFASVVFLESEFLGTRDHVLLSQIRDFPFRRLLRLSGSRWRYSTPPPQGLNSRLFWDPLKIFSTDSTENTRHVLSNFSLYSLGTEPTENTAFYCLVLFSSRLLIRCLAIDVRLVRSLAPAGVCLPCHCLAMSLYVTLYIMSDGWICSNGRMMISRGNPKIFSCNTSSATNLKINLPRLNPDHLHLVTWTVTSSLQSGMFYLQHTSGMHTPAGISNVLTQDFYFGKFACAKHVVIWFV
jgi:hypothetical protein